MRQRTRYMEGFQNDTFVVTSHPITSIRINQGPAHTDLIVFNRGRNAGQLIVNIDDADEIAGRLIPKGYWRFRCDFCKDYFQRNVLHQIAQGEAICTSCLNRGKALETELECPKCKKKFAECGCKELE